MQCAYIVRPAVFAEIDGEVYQAAARIYCDRPAGPGGFCDEHRAGAEAAARDLKKALAAPTNGAGSLPSEIFHRKRGFA
jgi:hypothetical protein